MSRTFLDTLPPDGQLEKAKEGHPCMTERANLSKGDNSGRRGRSGEEDGSVLREKKRDVVQFSLSSLHGSCAMREPGGEGTYVFETVIMRQKEIRIV